MSVARFFLFWGMHGVAEAFICAVVKTPTSAGTLMWSATALHVLSSYGMLYAVRREKGRADGWSRMMALMSLFLPVVGWVTTGTLYLARGMHLKAPQSIGMDEDLLPATMEDPVAPVKSRQKRIREELDVLPLADILAGPDIELKRGAVEQLAKLATPEAVALLIARRSDAYPETRFFVSTALTRIRSSWDEELKAAKARLRTDSADAEARVSLARVYIKSARSGLWDELAASHLLDHARHHLETAMDDPSVAGLCYADLLALYDVRGDHESAWDLVERLARAGELDDSRRTRLRAEICYRRGDFAGLVRELEALPQGTAGDKDWDTAAAFWSVGRTA